MSGLISVIIPVYNVASYIDKCVESVIDQTYKELEIILVDDGSTDDSGILCDRLAERDPRIKVFHKPNGGLSDARNYGIDRSHGDYLAFVDSDDRIHHQMYEILLKTMLRHDADMAACAYVRDESGFSDAPLDIEAIAASAEIYTGTEAMIAPDDTVQAMAWNKLYERKTFEGIRYPVGRLHEDEYVLHEILYSCRRVSVLPADKPLYFYTDRDRSITARLSKRRIEDSLQAFRNRVEFCVCNSWEEVIPTAVGYFCDLCINRYYVIRNTDAADLEDRDLLLAEVQKAERDMVRKYPKHIHAYEYRAFAHSPGRYETYIRLKNGIGRVFCRRSGFDTSRKQT